MYIPNEIISKIMGYLWRSRHRDTFRDILKQIKYNIDETNIIYNPDQSSNYSIKFPLHGAILDKGLRLCSDYGNGDPYWSREYGDYLIKRWNTTCSSCIRTKKIWKRLVDPIRPLQQKCVMCS